MYTVEQTGKFSHCTLNGFNCTLSNTNKLVHSIMNSHISTFYRTLFIPNHCTVYMHTYTMYTLQFYICIVHCTVAHVRCTLYSCIHVLCTLYSCTCVLYTVQLHMCVVQCTVAHVHCTLYSCTCACTLYSCTCARPTVLFSCALYTTQMYMCVYTVQ